jgi:hypothetical protein
MKWLALLAVIMATAAPLALAVERLRRREAAGTRR